MKYLNLLFITIAILTCSLASKTTINMILDDMEGQSQKEIFKTFHYLHLKEYDLNSEEGLQRYRIFKENMKWIKEKNSMMDKKIYGITQFSDMTQEEFNKKYLTSSQAMEAGINELKSQSLRYLKEEDNNDVQYHHHEHNHVHYHYEGKEKNEDKPNLRKVSDNDSNSNLNENLKSSNVNWQKWDGKAKTQLSCGSCWAFSTIAAIENIYHQIKGEYTSFSEQYLVDCDNYDNGCNGGWPNKTLIWIKKNGLVRSEVSKYLNKQAECDSSKKVYEYKIVKGFKIFMEKFPIISTTKTWEELQQQGPIIVSMDAGFEGFKQYRPKKFDPIEPKTTTECKRLTHAVVAVGTVNENGEDLIIARNSWGQTWGYEGYFKIPKKNSCKMMENAYLPIVYDGFVPPKHPPQPEPKPSDCVELYGWTGFAGKPKRKICDGDGMFNFGAFYGVKFPKKTVSKTPISLKLFKRFNCYGDYINVTETTEYPKRNGEMAYSFSLAFNKPVEDNCINFHEDVCMEGEPQFRICESIEDISPMKDKLANVLSINADSQNIKKITFYMGKKYKGKGYEMKVDEPVTNIWTHVKIKYYLKWKILNSIKVHKKK